MQEGPDGFRDFVVARSPALARTAYLLTGDRFLAEDLVQDALTRVASRWPKIVALDDPEPYVRRVLYRCFLDRRRRCSAGPAPGLAAALARLTPQQRAVLVLQFFDDSTEAQTSAVVGCSVGKVGSLTREAMARLQELSPTLRPEPMEDVR